MPKPKTSNAISQHQNASEKLNAAALNSENTMFSIQTAQKLTALYPSR